MSIQPGAGQTEGFQTTDGLWWRFLTTVQAVRWMEGVGGSWHCLAQNIQINTKRSTWLLTGRRDHNVYPVVRTCPVASKCATVDVVGIRSQIVHRSARAKVMWMNYATSRSLPLKPTCRSSNFTSSNAAAWHVRHALMNSKRSDEVVVPCDCSWAYYDDD